MAKPLFVPKLSRLGDAVEWLRGRGVPVGRLAGAFRATPEYIRVLAHRARRAEARMPRADRPSRPSGRAGLGIRPDEDSVVLSGPSRRRIEHFESRLDDIRRAGLATRDFPNAVRELAGIRALAGYPSSAPWLRLLARLHHDRAWFALHSGWSTTAAADAQKAMALAEAAFGESGDAGVLAQVGAAALIASQAHLLSHLPEPAYQWLSTARAVADRTRRPLGSEYHRQLGVAHLQNGRDDLAIKQFRTAGETMERLSEASHPSQVLLTEARHTSLLGRPNWERAEATLQQIHETFGPDALETAMTAHWTAAVAFSIGSPASHQRASSLVEEARASAGRFGHQATVSFLMALTPELHLPAEVGRSWIRWALYANAFVRR